MYLQFYDDLIQKNEYQYDVKLTSFQLENLGCILEVADMVVG